VLWHPDCMDAIAGSCQAKALAGCFCRRPGRLPSSRTFCLLGCPKGRVCRPLLAGDGLGTSDKDTRLACSGTVSPARPKSSLRNSHAISRRRGIGYALDQRFACSLRPIFCAFAPFPATRASAARPPAGTGTGGKDAPRGRVPSTPCVALGALLPHAIKLRDTINSCAPIIMRSPHSPFLRTGVVMPNRDSWASALAPRLSPKARGLHSSRTQAAGVSAATCNITSL
jgi:hypothetical protein